MKKILLGLISSAMILTLTGCEEKSINVNVENSTELNDTVLGSSTLIEIGDRLYYDSTTRIVYWWSGMFRGAYGGGTTPSPYFAPNGLPYRYNPETNTFEEINNI